ncbi:MAG: OmpA family protein [Cytophagales bacterium]|nr:MAG: OmpA family protein [Cytophagales bacterium]
MKIVLLVKYVVLSCFILMSILISQEVKAQKKKSKFPLIESYSEVQNFDINKSKFIITFVDVDIETDTILPELTAVQEEFPIVPIQVGKSITFLLPISKTSQINVKHRLFEDTVLTFIVPDEIKDFNYTVKLRPKKLDYAVAVTDFDDETWDIANVVLINKNRNERLNYTKRGNKNHYQMQVRVEDNYSIEARTSTSLYGNKKLDPKKMKAGDRIQLSDNLNFAYGSATISPNAATELDYIVLFMKDNPSVRLVVEGHTDSDGAANVNQALSEQRAKNVYNYMLQKGIAADRIIARGFGASRPLVPNTTAENKARNRRFDLVIQNL